MSTLSNLPPQRISTERHNAYGWIKPDADACHLCGKKEFTTPVEGFQVHECDKCQRLVCEQCAEIDCGGPGEGVSWQCEKECMSLDRVEWSIKELYKAAAYGSWEELYYCDALLTLAFIRQDVEAAEREAA